MLRFSSGCEHICRSICRYFQSAQIASFWLMRHIRGLCTVENKCFGLSAVIRIFFLGKFPNCSCRFVNDELHTLGKKKGQSLGAFQLRGLMGKLLYCLCLTAKLFRRSHQRNRRCGKHRILHCLFYDCAPLFRCVWVYRAGFSCAEFRALPVSVSKSVSGFFLVFPISVRKFRPVICLDTLNGIRELFNYMFQKLCGGICAVLFECFEIAEAAVFVDEGILIVRFSLAPASPDKAYSVEHISHLSVLFVRDMSSVHKVLEYIWDSEA